MMRDSDDTAKEQSLLDIQMRNKKGAQSITGSEMQQSANGSVVGDAKHQEILKKTQKSNVGVAMGEHLQKDIA